MPTLPKCLLLHAAIQSPIFCFRYSCASGIQGISPNCGDLYGSHLDCQWIDITGVPQGLYRLQLIVNPDGFVAESDRANNNLTCVIELQPPYNFRSNGCVLSGE